MKFIKSVLSLVFVLSLMACNNTSAPQEEKKENKRKKLDQSIVDKWDKQENNDLEIFYPPGWEFDSSGNMGTLFIIFAPLGEEDDFFQENISLVVQPLENTEITIDDYYFASIDDLKRNMENTNIQEEESLTNNNIDIRKIIFTTAQNDAVFNIQQYYFIHNKEAYIMTFTAEEVKFRDYIEYVDLIMNSFRFKE